MGLSRHKYFNHSDFPRHPFPKISHENWWLLLKNVWGPFLMGPSGDFSSQARLRL